MKHSTTKYGDVHLVEISGTLDSTASGPVFDRLVDTARDGSGKLIVEMSNVDRITHAGAGGLIVAARLTRNGGGAMRICGTRQSVRSFLQRLGYGRLLQFDHTLQASIAALSGPAERPHLTRKAAH